MADGKTRSRKLRTLGEIVEGGIWPDQGIMVDPCESRRHLAILHVLGRIPEDDFQHLCDGVDDWNWFIPQDIALGMVAPFIVTSDGETEPEREIEATVDGNRRLVKISGRRTAPFSTVLYLSPLLERAGWSIVVAVVAHELAHVLHGHGPFLIEDYVPQEAEAWDTVARWGFGREAQNHARRARRREARQRRMLERP